MIDVETIRRNFHPGHYDAALGAHLSLGGSTGAPLMDNHRALVHWNQGVSRAPVTGPGITGPKSDEEDDDDDEDRPFTPPPPRERLSYTRYQLELLNAIYKEVRYPNSTQKQLIAKRVGITREQVKIWFQNRRRKDVVGNPSKAKSCETSPMSTCSTESKDIEQQNSPAADSTENSFSEESNQSNDSEETVVPDVVMKSVIGELLKFVNDPLKGKRKKKRSKAKKVKDNKLDVKKGLAQTLLAGGYDMVSPPNQITPTAFFDKAKKGFSHSKGSSAFACPRDGTKPAQISSVSSSSETSTVTCGQNNDIVYGNSKHGSASAFCDQFALSLSSHQGQFLRNAHSGALTSLTGSSPCDIPVLSDLLSYKSCLEAKHKGLMSSANPHFPHFIPPHPHHQMQRPEFEKNVHHTMNSFASGRPMNGIFPFPFLAEHPVLLSTVRQPDQILRPSPQYPGANIGDDPYQALLVSSLSNPYYSPPSSSWPGTSPQNPTTYTQL